MSDTYTRIMALTPARRAEVLRDCGPLSDYALEVQYQDLLDEVHGSVTIAGHAYPTSDALVAVDPVAFRCGFSDWLAGDESLIEVEGQTYRVEDLDEMLDAHAEDAQ